MPKDPSIQNVLVIGAGPIVIGQACEFDYSGVQACLTLKEEGCRVILINSNPATIMTDPDMADATYIEPITREIIAEVIEKERPDAILPIVGGQTALNCTLELVKKGLLEDFGVKIIGATYEAIIKSENRECFKEIVKEAGLATPRSIVLQSFQAISKIEIPFEFPVIVRHSFALGGHGSGVVNSFDELTSFFEESSNLSNISGVLIEESVIGWKEFELEIMRDKKGNCIVVCSIENVDPMGIHTGDSITVAPAQTLTDKEYQRMRRAAFTLLDKIGITSGGCNVQFAVNPNDGRMVVIEVNPRVSRSSALASKATGFPIAKVATRLAIGYTLDEIRNEVTKGKIPASFEPAIDYVVTKIPRFNFDKFAGCDQRLTTQMKSIGEVMAIGRNFQESLQKALCSLEDRMMSFGFTPLVTPEEEEEFLSLKKSLATPGVYRLWMIADALRANFSVEAICHLTQIDSWFIDQIRDLIVFENKLKAEGFSSLEKKFLFQLKRKGFSDKRIAALCGKTEREIRDHRNKNNVCPVFKRIDSCAGEFPADTTYLYSTYDQFCEASPTNNKKILIIGSGPNRIGQGIEFDYGCVHAIYALREHGFEVIMVNSNPETVSTDYHTSDRLYFEPLTLENILSIVELERPQNVLVQFGGQTSLNFAKQLEKSSVRLLGISSDIIDRAENRQRFSEVLKKLKLKQPDNIAFTIDTEALKYAKIIGYPFVLRPSYILGGQAITLISNSDELKVYLNKNSLNGFPILMEKFLAGALEVEIDAIYDGKDIFIAGIMEQFEAAGIHSGDSICCFPSISLSKKLKAELENCIFLLARELNIIGILNVQLAIQNGEIYVLEVNPRASRTIPFISKALGLPLIKIAIRCLLGIPLKEQISFSKSEPVFFAVKAPVFPFSKLKGANSTLNMEMHSTGEVMGIGNTLQEAFLKTKLNGNMDGKDAIEVPNLNSCSKFNLFSLQEIYNL